MTDPKNMTDSELLYVMTNTAQAIAEYPDSRNTRRYANEILQCDREINRRTEEQHIADRKKTMARIKEYREQQAKLAPMPANHIGRLEVVK